MTNHMTHSYILASVLTDWATMPRIYGVVVGDVRRSYLDSGSSQIPINTMETRLAT